MTREEKVNLLNELLEIEEKNDIGNLTSTDRREFQQWVEDLEQEPCGDEYIKVPKKALKYRTAGMVAYNAEWLKDHFDIERAVICGAQQPSENAISRQAAKGNLTHAISWNDMPKKEALDMAIKALEQEPKTGHWIEQIDHEENCRTLICSNCDRPALHDGDSIWKHKFCPHCGAKMQEVEG